MGSPDSPARHPRSRQDPRSARQFILYMGLDNQDELLSRLDLFRNKFSTVFYSIRATDRQCELNIGVIAKFDGVVNCVLIQITRLEPSRRSMCPTRKSLPSATGLPFSLSKASP